MPLSGTALTYEEIERVRKGPINESSSTDDAVLLTAADGLHHDSHISDKTSARALAARYDEKHQIELRSSSASTTWSPSS
jgi:hypothetical protein